jgi:chorismate dehydratase
MTKTLRIGEYPSLGTMPFYFPLKHVFNEPNWTFVPGQPDELDAMLARGELDVALATPLAIAHAPHDYLIFPDLGYAGHAHVKDILLFSDLLLDDMDEMTLSLQEGHSVAAALMRIVLARYLQYQNEFIAGWGNAEAYLLAGDPALRERLLARYAYVYDVGDLWRHYTGKAMIYHLWVVHKEFPREKLPLMVLFQRLLKQAVAMARSDYNRLSTLLPGYDWLKKPLWVQLWSQVEYELMPAHFEGLHKFYEDCAEIGLIEEVPDLEYFEHD